MLKKILSIVVLAVPILFIMSIYNQMRMSYQGRHEITEYLEPTQEEIEWFVDAFMPGITSADLVSLRYARTGGREPPYVAILELRTHAFDSLRANIEFEGKGTVCDNEIVPYFSDNEFVSNLKSNTRWWTFDTNAIYETRFIQWKGDHGAKFFIPTSGNPVYVEAIVH